MSLYPSLSVGNDFSAMQSFPHEHFDNRNLRFDS
jgi:hypothetical protein